MQYGKIIQRAAQITWRHKVLWVFGIALALFGGMRGGGGGFQYTFGSGDMAPWARGMPLWSGAPVDWAGMTAALLAVAGVVILLGVLSAIVGILVRYTSVGALIGMAADVQAGQRANFGSGLRSGWRRFLRLLAIDLIIGVVSLLVGLFLLLAFFLFALAIALPAIAMFSAGGGWIALGIVWSAILGMAWLGLLILAALVVGIPFTIAREYSFRVAVLLEQGVFDAIGAALRLFRARLKQSAVIWLSLAAIRLGLGIVMIPIVVMLAAGLGVFFAAVVAAGSGVWPAILIGIPLALAGALAGATAAGIYTTFESVAWTLFYLELDPLLEGQGAV